MEKSAEAFRTISEVSELLDTPAHVLRFWESRFSQVRPVKRAGGRRYYRPNDLALLAGIKKLLHEDGLTIRGVQKILKEQGVRHVAGLSAIDLPAAAAEAPPPDRTHRWSVSPSPEAAAPGGRLLHDPDDVAEPVAGPPAREAPMHVDAPTLPFGEPGNVLPIAPRPAAGPAEPRQPAAAMLRAMDAVRAKDKKKELMSVYLRLVDLKERLAETGAAPRG